MNALSTANTHTLFSPLPGLLMANTSHLVTPAALSISGRCGQEKPFSPIAGIHALCAASPGRMMTYISLPAEIMGIALYRYGKPSQENTFTLTSASTAYFQY